MSNRTIKTCSYPECLTPAIRRDLCTEHFREERFFEKTQRTPDCWEWQGSKSALGYGKIQILRINWIAHRLSYFIHFGDIPHGLDVDHVCHNRSCVNPDHLRAVTRKQNLENQSGAHACNATGLRGVSKHRSKWKAQITHNGKTYYLGVFPTKELAGEAAKKARMELFTHNSLDRSEK